MFAIAPPTSKGLHGMGIILKCYLHISTYTALAPACKLHKEVLDCSCRKTPAMASVLL